MVDLRNVFSDSSLPTEIVVTFKLRISAILTVLDHVVVITHKNHNMLCILDIEQESKSGGGQKITRLGGFFNRNKKVEKPPQEDMSHLPPGMRLLILSRDCTPGHT